MPFLAPLAAPLIMGGASIGSSLLGSKLGKVTPSPQEQQVLQNDLAAQRMGLGAAQQLMPQGQGLLRMGAQAYQPVTNYWSSLLSGNRGLMTSALAPEIGRIGQGYQQAAQTSAALSPRGGPSAAFNAELPFQQQRDISTLMQQVRPQAAGGLASAAQGIGGMGSSLLGNAISSLYGATNAGQGILQQAQQARQLEAQRGQGIGAGLFGVLQQFGFPAISKVFGGLGSGGGFSTPKNPIGPMGGWD